MRRLLVVVVLYLTTASVAEAGWDEFWARFHLDYQRMNCWPEPFQHADRELVRGPLIAMTNNGWRVQNTLSNHLFTLEENTLTQAGTLKVRWIVTQTPPHRRTVYVLRGLTPEATLARVETVQQEIARMMPEGSRPEVLLTDAIPVGGSGDYFDAVDSMLKQSIPAPRLAPMQTETN
ncbi:MAG: hypothetical protein CMJ64_23705 [Planctomycetaceae bacterium]|nr:hypothetical protein [Planctomycetaceae bacterium]